MQHQNVNLVGISVMLAGLFLVGAGCQIAGGAVPAQQVNREAQVNVVRDNLADTAANAPVKVIETDNSKVNDNTMSENNIEVNKPTVPTSFPGVLPAEELKNKQVRIETNKGTIVFEILGKEGPKAASNFIALAKSGYYDGLTWHRVVPGFVIQGGDPEGTGRGGPGYKFEDDTVSLPYRAGTVAMANAGADTNGSQFFICLEDLPTLPPSYSVFGQVTSGMEVVRNIAIGDTMKTVTVEDAK